MRHIMQLRIIRAKYREKFESSMEIAISRLVKGFLNLYSVALWIRNSSKFASLMKQPKKQYTENKLPKQKRKAYRTVRTVPSDTTQTRARSGNSPIWMRIMSQPGAKEAPPIERIVRCSAKHTIEQRGIDSDYRGIHWGRKTTPENCQMLCKLDNRTKSGK